MARLDRDLKLMAAAVLFYAFGLGLYLQLLFVYALDLGASRFDIGLLTAIGLAATALSSLPGAWAAHRFRLKPVIAWVWWLSVPAGLCFALAPTWQWLIPGLVLTGLSMANNPVMKAYVHLKADDGRVARSITLVFGSLPRGPRRVAPARRLPRRRLRHAHRVLRSARSSSSCPSLAATLMRDTPYHAPAGSCSLRAATGNRRFRRYVLFFLARLPRRLRRPGVPDALPRQVHDQGYAALGVYASLAALRGGRADPAQRARRRPARPARSSIAGRARPRLRRPAPVAHRRHARSCGRSPCSCCGASTPCASSPTASWPLVRRDAAGVGLRHVRHDHGPAHGRRRPARRRALSGSGTRCRSRSPSPSPPSCSSCWRWCRATSRARRPGTGT